MTDYEDCGSEMGHHGVDDSHHFTDDYSLVLESYTYEVKKISKYFYDFIYYT